MYKYSKKENELTIVKKIRQIININKLGKNIYKVNPEYTSVYNISIYEVK